MRIYARLENEKGKVDGMGGNEQLMIEITGGNQLIARIRFNQIDAMKYHLDIFPVAYPDLLAIDVKGHDYKLTRGEVARKCSLGSCQNNSYKFEVCKKHHEQNLG